MNFDYKPTRKLSTTELPGVYVDPPLAVEFLQSPPYALTKFLLDWSISQEQDDELLFVIAEKLIAAFENHEGERYPMEGPQTITAFIEATNVEMLRAIIKGWMAKVGSERLADKKKSSKSTPQLNSTQARKAPIEK